MARLDPIPPKQWPPEMRDALAPLRPTDSHHPAPPREGRSKGLNALGTFAHHPALTRAFNTFNGHILFSTTLTPVIASCWCSGWRPCDAASTSGPST